LEQYIQTAKQDIFEARQLRLIIELKESGRAIGAIDLFDFDPFNERAGIGILIGSQDDRKKGFAREALETLTEYCFNTLMLNQLYCNVTEDNEDSLRLFINQGFIITGKKIKWIRTLDGWLTEYFLQKLKL
jgi:diamine N-acetyltransferase